MGTDFYQNSIQPVAGIIIKICRAYTNTREEFEDTYQEVCLQLWRSHGNFSGQSSWSTWVYRVALNVCLTMMKQKKSKAVTDISEDIECDHALADDQLSDTQELASLYSAIKQLNELDRALILLYLEEKSYQEMAEILGMSQSNIGVRISRVKEKLMQIINSRSEPNKCA